MTAPAHDRLEGLRDSLTGRPARQVLTEIAQAVDEARSLLITAHVNPDGDAVGSAVALQLAARALGKKAEVIFDSEPPGKLLPVVPEGSLRVVKDPGALVPKPEADLWVLLDTSEPERAGRLRELIFAHGQGRVCLDHHVYRGPSAFNHHLVLPESPSTGNLVLALILRLGAPVTREIAQALWMAISTDTGWFRFENTGVWALEDAALLAETGISIPWLYRLLYEEASPGRMRILGKVLSGLRTELGGALVYGVVSLEDITREGVSISDLDGVVDSLRSVQGARVAALIVEIEPPSLKVSLRAQGDLEVESIARKLGGGGHAKAAGCRFSGPLEQLLSILRAEVRRQLDTSPAPPAGRPGR